MAKKTKPRKTRTTSGGASEAEAPKKRGRQPNKWIEGFGPGNLTEYRKKHELSEAKLAAYLGTTLTSYRNWTGGKAVPSEAKQKELQELLAKDYVAPPGGEKKPRGRAKKAEGELTTSTRAARPAASNGDGGQVTSNAVAALALEYVRRLPSDRPLSMQDLEGHITRIKRALS